MENLRFLCPNCHSQTETYCGKNNKTGFCKGKWKVSDEEIIQAIKNTSNIKECLNSLGLSGGGNYARVSKLAVKVGKETHFNQKDIDNLRLARLKSSGINVAKFGWIKKASEILGISPQKTRGWIQKHYPEFLEGAFLRTS